MHYLSISTSVVCLLAAISSAVNIPQDHILWGPKGSAGATLVKRQTPAPSTTRVPDPACTNGPFTRACWAPGFSVATDFDDKWPITGRTVEYNLDLVNTTCNPDGAQERVCLLFNGQYPAPTIEANWGDLIKVTLKNSLTGNGTSIHWHGIRQLNTVTEDGVNGITECPLAPGDTKTYTFRATQFGTTWYHSHYSAQYGDGAVGALIINGPASANYDIDLGAYQVTDWYYKTAFQVEAIANQGLQNRQGPPPGDTILINGKNKNKAGGGSYHKTTLKKGKKYRLRIVNTSVDNAIRVSLDGHPFTVITSDLVPIKPFTANWVLLAVGQRYDVVFTANQDVGNYWLRAENANECLTRCNNVGRAVFSYEGAPAGDPTSTAATVPSRGCTDEGPLVPWVPNTVPRDIFASQAKKLNVDLTTEVTTNGQNVVVWSINGTGIHVDWEEPTLKYVRDGNTDYPRVMNLIEVPNEGTWAFWIIQEPAGSPPIPHPIHLHGHDFYVLGAGTGVFDTATGINSLKFQNPPRRDVAFLPGGGWLAIAYPTDNPGAWLMHCHIAWHVSQGLGVQFLEAKHLIRAPSAEWQRTCDNWATYWDNPIWAKQDSGL